MTLFLESTSFLPSMDPNSSQFRMRHKFVRHLSEIMEALFIGWWEIRFMIDFSWYYFLCSFHFWLVHVRAILSVSEYSVSRKEFRINLDSLTSRIDLFVCCWEHARRRWCPYLLGSNCPVAFVVETAFFFLFVLALISLHLFYNHGIFFDEQSFGQKDARCGVAQRRESSFFDVAFGRPSVEYGPLFRVRGCFPYLAGFGLRLQCFGT